MSNHEQSVEEARLNEMGGRDASIHAEIQDHLSQEALGLTDALHRLQHLRHSLAELTDSLPPPDSHTHGSDQSIGPNHTAIVLSNATAEDNAVPDIQRLRSTIPPAIMERLEEYEADSRQHSESASRGFSSGTLRTPISRQASTSRTQPTYRAPPFPDLVLPARRGWLEASLSHHRDTNSVDGSTVLGRRVAARAAAGVGRSSENAMPELDQIFLSRTAEMTRDLEAAVNRLAFHRAARLEQRVNEAIRNAGRLASDNNSGGTQGDEGRVNNHMASLLPGRSTYSTRRRRFGQTIGGMDHESSEFANATPSNPNVPTVATNFGPRPQRLPRDERDRPLSNSAGIAVEQPSETDNRSYLIRRRLNADGDEQVHNINLMDWDASESSMPPTPFQARDDLDVRILTPRVTRHISPFSSSMTSYPGPGPPGGYGLPPGPDRSIGAMHESTVPEAEGRRRNWARLDADGNEITTEMEDEIESAHVQSRIRALAQVHMSPSYATPTLPPLELGASRRGSVVSMTRTSITHAWNEGEGLTARVHISPRQTAIFPSTNGAPYVNNLSLENSVSAYSVPQVQSIHSPRHALDTFVADPLPIPLVDMVPRPMDLQKPYPRIVNVHKRANLAGR